MCCLPFRVAFLAKEIAGVDCYPGAVFPKLIGYGDNDTKVVSVDRNLNDLLALAIFTGEGNISGIPGSTDTVGVVTYDPVSDSYSSWMKVVSDVKDAEKYGPLIRFSGDGNTIVFLYYGVTTTQFTVILFDLSGNVLGSSKKDDPFGIIKSRDYMAVNTLGTDIYFLVDRHSYDTTTLHHNNFNSGTGTWTWNQVIWKLDTSQNDDVDQKVSMVLHNDNRLITFSTNEQRGGTKKTDCRMDVFDATDLSITTSLQNKGSRDFGGRNCRFPSVHQQAADGDNAEIIVLVLTQYFNIVQSGFLRIKLQSDYSEATNDDDEIVFGTYQFDFKAAYYTMDSSVPTYVAYAIAVDMADGQNYLIHYDWTDPNKFPDLYPIKGWSEDPSAGAYVGNSIMDAVIYNTNAGTNDDDFPVKGYMVGRAKTVWTYNDCLAPDFGRTVETYDKLIDSPSLGAYLGIVNRIELNVDSCMHEFVNNLAAIQPYPIGSTGNGRTTTDSGDLPVDTSIPVGGGNLDYLETQAAYTPSVADLPLGVTAGDWEATINTSLCLAQSADETFHTFKEALFEGDDIIEYEIGSGLYNVPFVDWTIDASSYSQCTVNLVYDVRESISGVTSSDLSVLTPVYTNLNVGIQSSDLSIDGIDHTVTVQAMAPSYQCMQKDFTVKPYTCTNLSTSGAFWLTNSQSTFGMQYTIGSTVADEQVKFTASIAACTFEVLILDDDDGDGVWTTHTGVLTIAQNATPLSPGQFIYDVSINTSDLLLDPGTSYTGLTKTYKISVASPDHVQANNAAGGNPKEFFLDIEYRNECRDIFITDKALNMMENIIGEPAVFQIVPDFIYTPVLSCGTQSITVYEDGSNPTLPYSSFLTSSGMTLSLQSNTDSHAGDYYVKVDVSFSNFPTNPFRNYIDMLVRLKKSCKEDIITQAVWLSTNTQSKPSYDSVIGYDSIAHTFSPTVINTQSSYCTLKFFLQEEDSLGAWNDYTGALVSLDTTNQQLTITSTLADLTTLENVTKHFRVAISSTTVLTDALNPVLIDIYVKYVHPCNGAVLQDNGGITTPISNTFFTFPHPSPVTETVINFGYDLEGSVDCGTQTMVLVPVTAITPGTQTDFITLTKDATGDWEIEVAPTNVAQMNLSFFFQIQVTLDNWASVAAFTSLTVFEVKILPNCDTGVVNNFLWLSNGTGDISPALNVYLDGSATIESFMGDSSLTECDLAYELEILSGASYQAYTDSNIVLDATNQRVTLSSTDDTLDQTTDQMRIRAATSNGGSQVGAYSEITFSVKWVNICNSGEVLVTPYPNIYAQVHGETKVEPAPQMSNSLGIDCGLYSIALSQPLSLLEQGFLTWTDGAVSVTSTDLNDSGSHVFFIDVAFVDFPSIVTTIPLTIFINECTPAEIVPPVDEIGEVIHVVGTYQSARDFRNFTQIPDCQSDLNYSVLHSNGTALDPDMRLKLRWLGSYWHILVETRDAAFVDTYELQIQAESSGGVKNEAPYLFTLLLLSPEAIIDANTPPELVGVDGSGLPEAQISQGNPFSYILPPSWDREGDDFTMTVFLGDAENFLGFDPETGTIYSLDPTKPIEPGSYRIAIILVDNNPEGKRAREYFLDFTVNGNGDQASAPPEELDITAFSPAEKYLKPVISLITIKGEVTLVWDRDIVQVQNQTWYEEQLRRKVALEDMYTESRVVKPAFEVEFVPSYMHQEAIKMEWEYIGWENDRELKLRLIFDKTEIVSMETPQDYLNITFWDQGLFMTSGGLYVERQKEIEKRIPPQVPDSELTSFVDALAQTLLAFVIGGIVTSLLMGFFLGYALTWLWNLLHAFILIVHLPIFSVRFPGFAFILYEILIFVAQFDLIEVDGTMGELFNLNLDEEPYSEDFARLDYNYQNFLMNSGGVSIATIVTLGAISLSLCLKICQNKSARVKICKQKLDKGIYWNMILRSMLELSLEMAIIAFVDIRVANLSSPGYDASFAFAILALVSLCFVIYLLRFVIRKKYSTLKSEEMKQRFGALYDGLNLKSKKGALKFTEWSIVRRVIYAAAAVFAVNQLWLQFFILFNSSLLALFIVGTIRPFDQPLKQRIECINEITMMLILYHMICFTDIVPSAWARSYAGLSCFFFTLGAILFNLLILFESLIYTIKLHIKRHIGTKRHEHDMQMRAEMQKFKFNPDKDILQRKIQEVEVKAKQTSYLNSIVGGNRRILANASPDYQLSNLNQRGTNGAFTKLPDQGALLPQGQGRAQGKYKGFNVDLQMFPSNLEKTDDLSKLFYGQDQASLSQTLAIAPAPEAPTVPPTVKHADERPAFFDLTDFQLEPKQQVQPKPILKKPSLDDLPAGIGKKIHFDLL